MSKYLKVMFGTTSGANKELEYKLNEINVATNWHPQAQTPKEMGGFNYTTEDCILRWLHRGDTVYDIKVPKDAENIKLNGATTIYRTNKIIISNPRKIDDELALHFYKISNIPEKSYYKALGAVSIMNYKKTAYAILKDKINNHNIDDVLKEWNDFISHGGKDDREGANHLVNEVETYLSEIKSDLLISRFVDKKPYIKDLTNDKVINITGESGSGKSFFCDKYTKDSNCIVIDTDRVFSNRPSNNKAIMELRDLFSDQDKDYLLTNFDEFYLKVLNYFKDRNKTIVIDSAQYRNIKDYSILRGKIVIMRTSIETCYARCIKRFKESNPNYTKEELEKYCNKKKGIYEWYQSLNNFINTINKIG